MKQRDEIVITGSGPSLRATAPCSYIIDNVNRIIRSLWNQSWIFEQPGSAVHSCASRRGNHYFGHNGVITVT